LVCDTGLSAVTFFGAAGVTVLHAARSRQDEQQRLVLVAAGRPVARVLGICEVAYPRYSELDHALAACDQVISP
jgi:anti-anti-sigma regulatory factor